MSVKQLPVKYKKYCFFEKISLSSFLPIYIFMEFNLFLNKCYFNIYLIRKIPNSESQSLGFNHRHKLTVKSLSIYSLKLYQLESYRVFFIERQIRISYKMLKISLFHVGSGLRTEVTMGHLISDKFKTHF